MTEITKVIEGVDELFPEIVVNGESHVSERYVAPPQASTPASTPQTQEEESTQPQQTVQGEYVDKLNLNGVEHDLKDSPLSAEVRALQELLGTIQSRLNELSALIPNQASAQNQLADKNFVNSSIATNTANFLGTYTSLADIEAIQNPTNNDYAFLETADGAGNNVYDRYKYSAEDGEWLFEYELNNSSFTAEQWATINSGITQVSDTVQDGDTDPVSSDAVYEALQNMAVTPVNVVENGNMHSVTSNAVAGALSSVRYLIPIRTTFASTNSTVYEYYKQIGDYFRTYFNSLPEISGKTKKVHLLFNVYTQSSNVITIGLKRRDDEDYTVVLGQSVWGGIGNEAFFSSLYWVEIDPSYLDSYAIIGFKTSNGNYQVGIGYCFAEVYYE